MASSIGIKLADGSFFPILDEGPSTERDLELTTMRDDQESVQINLFKKVDETEPEYIGSLIVEDLTKGVAGDPTINLKIKLDEEENLSAEAIDQASGSKQSLKVSLKTLNEDMFDVPDFDLSMDDNDLGIGEDPNQDDIFVPEAEDMLLNDENSEENITEEEEYQKKKFPLWAIILIILLCIGALVLAILLLIKPAPDADANKVAKKEPQKVEKTNDSKAIDSTTSNPPKEDAKEKEAAEAKKKAEQEAKERAEAEEKKRAEEEAKRKAEEAAKAEADKKKAEEEAKRKEAAKKKSPKMNSEGVVKYRLKWGDTLWDLSESFYKTPWDYIKIARHNKIKNPNVIIAGTYIEIPPK